MKGLKDFPDFSSAREPEDSRECGETEILKIP